jgi:hypothetical protein
MSRKSGFGALGERFELGDHERNVAGGEIVEEGKAYDRDRIAHLRHGL